MFHSIDLLVGIVTVMMVLSLVVTMVTQLVLDLLKLRWLHLREGISAVLADAGADVGEIQQVLKDSPLRGRTSVSAQELAQFGRRWIDGQLFDATMTRVSQRFTQQSRVVVLGVAGIVALVLPLDTLDLIQALSKGEGVVLFPATLSDWSARWAHVNAVGVALSTILLSLGAPAWFEVLKDLLKLRGEK
jgi:hypothetical protein